LRTYCRRLPHFQSQAQPVFVTWRLADSLPPGRLFPSGSLTSGEAFVAMDRLLDEARTGPQFLRQPEIADMVADNIRELTAAPSSYQFHAYVVMPNHVHILITPNLAVDRILRLLKGRTARFANQALGRAGTFWQEESYDRLVREAGEFARTVRYIEINPVRAGLVTTPEAYPWSSAKRD
jgi:putative transposase